MACRAMHFWTFTGLVGAFLDLVIAYFLLCASIIAFFVSTFLGIFGLYLPCPCDGQFLNPNRNYCLKRLLVDCPTEKVSSVQFSVKSKFPFDSIFGENEYCHLNLNLVGDNVDGVVELEGEASCSLISDSRKSQNVGGRENGIGFDGLGAQDVKERRIDLKGKGIMNQRPKGVIRRRRKGGAECGKFSSVASHDPACVDQEGVPQSHCSIHKEQNEIVEDEGEAPIVMKLGERAMHDFELTQPLDDNQPSVSFVEELRSDAQGVVGCDRDEKNTIRVLEQALEEEHAARAALYLELEKERNAAATAADEAMAMILRLQEEKASIEMEARQYQRLIEEKSAYDAEEMNILKEILLRREREKHFLEKEVEAYRQMPYLVNEQLQGDVRDMVGTQRQELDSSVDLTEDPVLMLHQLSQSIDRKEMLKNRIPDTEVRCIDKQNYTVAVGNALPIRGSDEDADFSKQGDLDKRYSNVSKCINDGNQELQEKEMVSVDNDPYAQPKEGHTLETFLQSYSSSSSQEHNFLEKTIPIVGEEQEQNGTANLCQGLVTKTSKTNDETGIYFGNDGQILKHGKDAYQESNDHLMLDKEPRVHDVHVIDDDSKLCNEISGNRCEQLSVNDITDVHRISDLPRETSVIQKIEVRRDCPSTSRLGTETDINRSSSDMTIGLPPMGSQGRSLLSDLRRNSMSALDNEKSKIDYEVGWLRERLRIVQEGREKLNLSVDHLEREKLQLQLLEDIASQLREIRQLTEPGKAERQVSLPPPSSKVMSKKRRCRSASSGVYKSS